MGSDTFGRYGIFGCMPYGKHKVPYIERGISTDGNERLLGELHFDARRMPHREPEEGPAIFMTWPSGTPKIIEYRWHGYLHRDRAPAAFVYDEDGTLVRETWARFGRWHRKDGPASIERVGEKAEEQWWIQGYAFRDTSWWLLYDLKDELDDGLFEDWVLKGGLPERIPSAAVLRRWFGELKVGLG
jgi:YD repeat-containing protein